MAIVHIDGFDVYNASHTVATRYASASGISIQTGRFGGFSARLISGSLNALFANTADVTMGCSFKMSTAEIGFGINFIRFRDSGLTTYVTIKVTAAGAIQVLNPALTVVGTSAGGLVTADTWNHIEVQVHRHASTGTVTIKFNGTAILTLTGLNTGSADYGNVNLVGAQNTEFDDWFVRNDLTWVGEARVETLLPSADTADKDWTASTGTDNYAVGGDFDGDTDYVSSATVGHKDMYAFADLSNNPTSIAAVQTRFCGRKDDVTTRELRMPMQSGATLSNGTTRGMTTSYADSVDIYATDPDTAAAWDGVDVNAIEAGIEVVT